jgi:hypothetical protein
MWLFSKLFRKKPEEISLEKYLRQYGKWATLEEIYATMDKAAAFLELRFSSNPPKLTDKEICEVLNEHTLTSTSWSECPKTEVQPRELALGWISCAIIIKGSELVDLSCPALVEYRRRIESMESAEARSRLFYKMIEEMESREVKSRLKSEKITEMGNAELMSLFLPEKITEMENAELSSRLLDNQYVAFCAPCGRYYSGYQCVKTPWSCYAEKGTLCLCPKMTHHIYKIAREHWTSNSNIEVKPLRVSRW